jgi:hypothetical protein
VEYFSTLLTVQYPLFLCQCTDTCNDYFNDNNWILLSVTF